MLAPRAVVPGCRYIVDAGGGLRVLMCEWVVVVKIGIGGWRVCAAPLGLR